MEIKRIFRIRYKIDEPGTMSHITQRAPGIERLFIEKEDYLYILHLLKETSKKFLLEVFAFVLMPNHIHILFKQLQKNLSIAMKSLFERYADVFNKKYERKGHVFCGRFRQAVCLDENYLFAITIYIHMNAVKTGLVADPLDYQWSSCKPYLMPIAGETFLNYKYILSLLNPDIERARQLYRTILYEAIKIQTGNVLEDPKAMNTFRNKLNQVIHSILGDKIEQSSIFDIDIEKKINELKSKKRLRSPSDIEGRRYLIQQLISRGYKIPEIAEKLGVSRQLVYLNLTK